ncbi:MAG: heavy-metal-associated domain-containing protein [Chloroflexi bacterium]|nr:heavy-metal-associated domain-containing protein [Chloroflexota bacterium]
MDDMNTLRLRVISQQNLHCAGCERTAEYTLTRIPGVKSVKANHKTQIIEVDMSLNGEDIEKVKAELKWIGYEVEVV